MTETMPERGAAGRKIRPIDAPIPECELLEPERDEPEFRTSMCCECGDVRTVKSTARIRGGMHGEPRPNGPAGVRCTELLKCQPCGVVTTHAYLRDDSHRDWAEKEDAKVTARIRELIGEFEEAGVTVAGRAPFESGSGTTGVVELFQWLGDESEWQMDVDFTVPFGKVEKALEWAWSCYQDPDSRRWWFRRGTEGTPYRTLCWSFR